MTYSGRLLAKARERLEERRSVNAAEQNRRLTQVHLRCPGVKAVDEELRGQMVTLAGLAISRDSGAAEKIKELERKNLALQMDRAELLTGLGLPVDYTDEIYDCKLCRDTGMVGGAVCSCLDKLYNMELTRELGTLLRCGDESFQRFRLDYYDSAPDPVLGDSPRACMEFVYNTCKAYARDFSHASPNLLFQGGTGLGKTYLSACIAREVASRGFSVAYDSAGAALSAFEIARFSRDDQQQDEAAGKVRQYLNCGLMILDDLGTEMITSFSTAALYQIINTRLINSRQTIISTNLSWEELSRKYTAQITSRLDGEYVLLPFVGRDIRTLKKEK